ncbi:HAMP domain-containing protein [Burkholderia sp. Bp9017]|uniref:histidine kinase n=2 Tax=Burkholderia TaxID=32008 RepID=A0A7T7AK06_9BURK|nr:MULTISPECIES: ATP-binding protein [Burkholderia]QQK05252.1 PAS-domain containing protein [Burkholderia anthina]RQZ20227.1 HAMP domain-containing protein [Burkholderia sp. Bp9017]RQZ29424.1 HAMP domain-containing protein [Burkholderia sp. Bp9016]
MRATFRLLPPWSVRAKLIATFLLLFGITLAVVVVGVLGMRANQNALDEYEANVVPEIARALELSDKVAQLAAVAPSMMLTDSSDLLHNDTELLRGLLGDIRRLSPGFGKQPGPAAKAGERLAVIDDLDAIDQDLARLLIVSGRQRQLKEELSDLRVANDRIGASIARDKSVIAKRAPTLLEIWARTAGALQAANAAELGSAESDNEALWLRVRERGEDRLQPALADALQHLDGGARSVFAVRREFLSSEAQTGYLVTLLRGHADHLSGKSARYVERLRQIASERSDKVRKVAVSSQSGLLLLAVAGVAVALLGVAYASRILHKLQAMTRVMARLAKGITSDRMPSTHRPDEIGELARAFEVFRTNLIEKEQLTQGLESQRRLQESVLNSMNDGVSVHDTHGSLIAWNPPFATLLGIDPGALHSGLSLAALRQAMHQPARWRQVSRETATRTSDGARIAASAELHLRDQRTLEFHCQPLPDGGWVAVCRDLTSRRAVEAELRQAQKMDVLGQLTGGVAHDFNNFLVAILGNLELLLPRLEGQQDAQTMAERARRAAERASRLTRRLLAFARRQPLRAERVSVRAMLAEMLDLVEYSAGQRVAVVLEPAADPMWVNVDRGQLENAVLNLTLNSAAAMPDGGELALAARREPAADGGAAHAIVLSVTDTGCGIAPVLLDKVIEPFFTTKAAGEGSGLGLSSVYGFVRQSGGDLRIHSEVGRGTRVELWLPESAPPDRRGAPAATAAAPVAARAGARVLVVDDDPEVRDTALSQFAALGARADAVDTGDAALRWLTEHGPVTLVLSDISLGAGGSGIALAARLAERWPAQRVALTSGLPPEIHQTHPDWRADLPFVPKPFDLAALAALLG